MILDPMDPGITAAIFAAAHTWGGKYGVTVPAELVRAIIVRESAVPGSKPLVVNSASRRREPDGRVSYGLMQVLDTTAADLGLIGDPAAMEDVAIGISYGVKYLARQLARYGGDVAKAVSAYNAGTATSANQSYTDYVLGWFNTFAAAVGGAPGAAGVGVVVLVLALWAFNKKG